MITHRSDNVFISTILKRYVLSKEGSSKKTYHITLDLADTNIPYKVGDSIGIFPENSKEQVADLLSALSRSGEEEVVDPRSGAKMTLQHFLKYKASLSHLTTPLLTFLEDDPTILTEKHEKRRLQFIKNHDLIDLFSMCSPKAPLQEIISYFKPLLPRLYSVASAPTPLSSSVDLLVAAFTYRHANRERKGVASTFLTEIAHPHTTPIHTFCHSNPHFALPDPNRPVLMIGVGTGVAPYRAFLQQRDRDRASGLNWLIFGERNRNTDFYYEPFFTSLQNKGFLRLDLAFSRDQKEKIYVQQRLLEEGADVWKLIQNGGTIYICGDARRMAKSVVATLHTLIETQGNFTTQVAQKYLRQMRRTGRLLMDVY